MTHIGIVGSGISALHLALRLQQHGTETTLYPARPSEELSTGPARNFVSRFGRTQQRDDELGVHHWRFPDAQVHRWQVQVAAEDTIRFGADPVPSPSVVDFRVYLPRLLEDYVQRGGRVVVEATDAEAVRRLGKQHDLMVVADGGRAAQGLFPADPQRSPYSEPQRLLCGGLYRGVTEDIPHSLDFFFLPGLGEILRFPFYSLDGRVDMIAFEAVPGGPLAAAALHDHGKDPDGFHRTVLQLLERFAPGLRERIDTRGFGLTRPLDLLQGGLTPVVRTGWAPLDDGRYAVAVGDAWILNDPLTAQGANLASRCAFELADAIMQAGPQYDEGFCRTAQERMWAHARPVVEWTNAFLGPPPPHALRLLAEAGGDPRVADAFVNGFNDPAAMWRAMSSPEGTEAFLAAARSADRDADQRADHTAASVTVDG